MPLETLLGLWPLFSMSLMQANPCTVWTALCQMISGRALFTLKFQGLGLEEIVRGEHLPGRR